MLLTKGEKNLPCPCGIFSCFVSLFEGATIVSTIGEETAEFEGSLVFANEANMQIQESKEHAEHFMEIMKKAEKRFSALAKVEERHAKAYEDMLNSLEFKQALLGGK